MRHLFIMVTAVVSFGCATGPVDELGECSPPPRDPYGSADAGLAAPPRTAAERALARERRFDLALDALLSLTCQPATRTEAEQAAERAFRQRLEAQRGIEEIGQR